MRSLALAFAFAAVLGFSNAAFAAGFALENQSARATGMGNAYTAVADDASSVFFNPAGLANGSGFSLQLGDTLLAPSVHFTSPTGRRTTSTPELSPPPHLYARYVVTPKLAVGVGVFSPYGASISWPDGWEGAARAKHSKLVTYALEPAVAYEVHPKVRFGAGISLLRGTVELSRALDLPDEDGEILLGGGGFGVGFHAGVHGRIIEDWLEAGVAWRSGARMRFEGNAHFEGEPAELAGTLKDQAVSTSVRLPDIVSVGLSSKPLPRLRVALDAHYTAWSQFDALRLTFEDPALDSQTPKDWHDTVSVHLGGEFAVTQAALVRAGVTYDPTASPQKTLTPELPDATRYKLAVGGGYAFRDVRIDGAYQLVVLGDAVSTHHEIPGTYAGLAHVVALTVGWTPGGAKP